MEREVWFQLVDAQTRGPFAETRATAVQVADDVYNVDRLGRKIQADYDHTQPPGRDLLAHVAPSQLKIYANRASYDDENGQPLDPRASLGDLDEQETLIVKVPAPVVTRKRKRSDQSILDQLEALEIATDEFQLDALAAKQENHDPVVMTPGLNTFWDGFGDFPKSYFVRMEVVMFWTAVKRLLPNVGKKRIVIVGSPGVGKSCFLMLVGFYMACVEKSKVLIIRRLKEGDQKNSVVHLDGRGSFARTTNLSRRDLEDLRKEDRLKGASVLVDRYPQAEVNIRDELDPFHLLATSCQYDTKQDDPSIVVVLPAWQRDDLLQYARLTNWVIDTELRKTKYLSDSTWPKLVNEQYFYSGGSLREFCKKRDDLRKRVTTDCGKVGNNQAYQLVYTCGGDRSNDQVDRIRRHYITDRKNESHYSDTAFWKVSLDSGYAMKLLGRYVGMEKQLEVYKYAQSIGAGFQDTAYEMLLHHAVHEAFVKKSPVVLKMRSGSYYERIQIFVPHVQCSARLKRRATLAWPI